jgi:sorting nexin-8
LFEDDTIPGTSPWGLPTPKKAPKADLIKNLLPSSDVPISYVDIFDSVLGAGDGVGGKISASGVTKVLSAARLGADDQSRIVNLLSSGGQLSDLSRNEFNVLLALIGLAQEHEDITLDSVDERRRSQCFFEEEIVCLRLIHFLQIYQSHSCPPWAQYHHQQQHSLASQR